MTFRAEGNYTGIRRFIHRLETTGPYLFIESLDAARSVGRRPRMKRAGDSERLPDGTMVLFNVRVITFLRPDPAAPPGARTGKRDSHA
jgi:hypothetical protein